MRGLSVCKRLGQLAGRYTTSAPRYSRALPFAVRAMASMPAVAEQPVLMDNQMLCFQCEQTKGGTGCTTVGVCGKTPEVNALQELLTYSLQSLSCWAAFAERNAVAVPPEVPSFLHAATFSILTNVNFDPSRYREYLSTTHTLRDEIEAAAHAAGVDTLPEAPSDTNTVWAGLLAHPARWKLAPSYLATASDDQLHSLGNMVSLEHRRHLMEPTLLGLQEMIMYALRGLSAYAHHAEVLSVRIPEADAFVVEAYEFMGSSAASSIDACLAMVLRCGEVNLKVMEGLDRGHTTKFGHPEPSPVQLTPTKGPAILVSGHDLQDLNDLLEATSGTGINVFTHGEMLPAHGYPVLKKFPHLVGNFGGAWYKQQKEFSEFPGAILMTTNCIIEPRQAYSDRIYTTGEVGYPGVNHIRQAAAAGKPKDYSGLISRALELPGFTHEPEEHTYVTTGFAHNAALAAAGDVVDAIQAGKLSHIFLVGGCDGSEPDRKYFGRVAEATPDDTLLLTLGCGKFRFYDNPSLQGKIPGTELPRMLDMGQCNDAYSAIVVASALADALKTDVNGLPLTLALSWLEQKAIIVLCSLLALGVKNIRIGPKAPAFLTPEALAVLVEKFDLKITNVKDPQGDVQAMMAGM